ncbi:hypothetical protein DdX_10025 [Ditylenchus destructor]|uniref:Uncharacterized protein n=1 Tax=Ditylenchus destructor TaxID=166010 RepID=A0AAD4N1L7_9BILA|nr:hypothetical protein DdX_10025 [Ditylenchus destructor]
MLIDSLIDPACPSNVKPSRYAACQTSAEMCSESFIGHESLLKNPNPFENSSFNDKPHQTKTRSDYFAKPDYQGCRQKLETQRAPGRNQMWRVNGSYDNIREQTFNSRTKLAGSRQRSRSLPKTVTAHPNLQPPPCKAARQALAVKEITKEKAKKIDREKRIKQLLGEDLARGYSLEEWWKLQATPNFAITENYDASPVRIPMKRAVGGSGKALKLEKKKSSADEFARNRQALAVKEITKEKAKKIDREKRIKQLLGEDLARGYSLEEWWKLQATPNFAITENYDASPVRIPMKRAVGGSGKALKLEKKKSSADEFARNVKSEEDKKYIRFLG